MAAPGGLPQVSQSADPQGKALPVSSSLMASDSEDEDDTVRFEFVGGFWIATGTSDNTSVPQQEDREGMEAMAVQCLCGLRFHPW